MRLDAASFKEELRRIFSWLSKNYSRDEVANILANFWLAPQATPTTEIGLEIYQAKLRIELVEESLRYDYQPSKGKQLTQRIKIPQKIVDNCRNFSEAVLITLDGVQPTGIIDIEDRDFKIASCFCFAPQLEAKKFGVKIAEVSINFGAPQSQKIQILADQITKIPLKVGFTAELTINCFENYQISGKKKLSTPVTGSQLGLIFDGRGRPILPPGDFGERVKRINSWRQALAHSDDFSFLNF